MIISSSITIIFINRKKLRRCMAEKLDSIVDIPKLKQLCEEHTDGCYKRLVKSLVRDPLRRMQSKSQYNGLINSGDGSSSGESTIEEMTNARLLEIYEQEFEKSGFPIRDFIPRRQGMGAKTFLVLERYLHQMGIIEESRYRNFLEGKGTEGARRVLN